MAHFVIDNEIREWFDHFRKFCDLMADADYESEFEPGLTLEQIEEWERENDTELPHQYKSWLMLTGHAYILGGELELSAPETGTLEEDDDIVIIGTTGDGAEAGIRREDGTVYSMCDGDIRKFKDFDDLCRRVDEVGEDIGSEASNYLKYTSDDFTVKITGESMGMTHTIEAKCYVKDGEIRYYMWNENPTE